MEYISKISSFSSDIIFDKLLKIVFRKVSNHMSQLVVSARSVRCLMLILKWFYVEAGICRWWLIIMIMIGMTTCFVMWLIGQIALVSLLVIVWNHGRRQDSNRSIQRIRIEIKSASRIFRVVTSVTLDCWWFEKKP